MKARARNPPCPASCSSQGPSSSLWGGHKQAVNCVLLSPATVLLQRGYREVLLLNLGTVPGQQKQSPLAERYRLPFWKASRAIHRYGAVVPQPPRAQGSSSTPFRVSQQRFTPPLEGLSVVRWNGMTAGTFGATSDGMRYTPMLGGPAVPPLSCF